MFNKKRKATKDLLERLKTVEDLLNSLEDDVSFLKALSQESYETNIYQGYACYGCGSWIVFGTLHSCNPIKSNNISLSDSSVSPHLKLVK